MSYSGSLITAGCGVTEDNGAFSGQTFVNEDGGYNLVVAYCNGNDPTDVPPSAYDA